ncbi:cobyrinate a,c-diamide synthase [Bacillus salitolerans]|uniref:Cobyrinate a,c-diamide synthase n=1 Tax=Bacillus salitolerans TaxID=1437434 RepID=A0ABW4LXN3_9BACI
MRIAIAGMSSGVGKTSITIGMMKAFIDRGLTVQGFKCGPDFIDPSFHTHVTGRPSRNLDSWLLTASQLNNVLQHGSKDAAISIIEGVMGYYDGKEPTSNIGSTAEICQITNTPVLLVVDCWAVARSAAAIVKGFQMMKGGEMIVGVIANRVGSKGHYFLVKQAIEEECGVPVIGYLLHDSSFEMPERHLGLIPVVEQGNLDTLIGKLGQAVSETIDLDQILLLAEKKQPEVSINIFEMIPKLDITIAVARDAAFHFYYEDNIQLLMARGANIVYFSPLNNEEVPPGASGLYLGGGFPEVFARELSNNDRTKASIQHLLEEGMPAIAECGGFMYLAESIETDEGVFPMVGIFKGTVKMNHQLVEIGYREVMGSPQNPIFSNSLVKGQVFHHSSFTPLESIKPAYDPNGYQIHQTIAGYVHFHFLSCPRIIDRWLVNAQLFKKRS